MSRVLPRLLAGIAVLGALLAPASAHAWCRTAGCDRGVGSRCEPVTASDCGTVLAWPTPCLGYSLQVDGTRFAPFERVRELVELGFAQWQDADCGGSGSPKLVVKELGPVACSTRGFDVEGPNSNLIVFRDDDWPYAARALALTTVTYGLDTGTIRDADMEINTTDVVFTFDDVDPQYDFQSILTHEAGHFLGLAHSTVDGATMVLNYEKATTDLRSLDPDDVAGICAIYPPGDPGACEPTPEGGLEDECNAPGGDPDAEDGGGGCCTIAAGSGRPGGAASVLAAIAGLGAAAARRRARARS